MAFWFGKRERGTKFESQVKSDLKRMENVYGALVDSQIRLMERATNAEERARDLFPEMTGESGNKTPDFVKAITEWLKEAPDIPAIAKAPIIEYLKGRRKEINAMATGFIDNTVQSKLKELTAPKQPTGQ